MNIDDRPTTDDRPQGLFTHFGKISNGHNSAMRQPIPFMFGSRVGLSATYYPIHCMYVRRPYFAVGL